MNSSDRPIAVLYNNLGEISMSTHKAHSPAFLAIVNAAKARVTECTVDDVLARLERGEKFRLLDVREDNEWLAGHIEGAEHLGKGIIERDIENRVPNKDEPVVLYCGGGFRSALAADALQQMGYTHVVSMDGGWRGWVERGLPTVK
jgi:rhodanese-related sulfurtransferase